MILLCCRVVEMKEVSSKFYDCDFYVTLLFSEREINCGVLQSITARHLGVVFFHGAIFENVFGNVLCAVSCFLMV